MINEDEPLTLTQIQSIHEDTLTTAATSEELADLTSCKRAINTLLELNDDELMKIEENLRMKILKNGECFMQKFDCMQADMEKVKTEYEQNFKEMEAMYIETQVKFESELKNAHLFQARVNENDDKLNFLSKQNMLLTDDKEMLTSSMQRLNTVNQNLEIEKRELHNRLNKIMTDNDRLNQDWKILNTKLTESESRILDLTLKLDECQAREATISFREKQFDLDKKRLMNEIQWLNEELEKKSSLILQNKSDSNRRVYEFEANIEELTAENKKLKALVENLQTANESMESQVENLTSKLQEVRDKFAENKIDFKEESESRERLLEMYKEENSRGKQELEDAAKAIIEFQKIVVDVKSEYSSLFDEKKMNETAYEAKLKESGELIAKLEQELKNANELLSIAKRKGATVLSESDIQQLSPAAAVASRLLKNGMTLTQIYSEYVNLTETLHNEKNENQRLKSYVNEIIKDIEEKAPVLKKQRAEYEEAIQSNETLTVQLENAMMDYEVLKSKSEDSIKKYNLVNSENVRLRHDVNDLSRQVAVLLHEIEKLRSKLLGAASNKSFSDLSCQQYEEANSDADQANSEILSKDILLFRNIEELQKQNKKLVRLVHEITDKKQSEEKLELESRTKEYNEKMMLALKELEEFKVQREKHEMVLEEIRKQRDTYKHLLSQQGNTPNFCTSTPGGQRLKQLQQQQEGDENSFADVTNKQEFQEQTAQLDLTNQALQKLQKQFENYQHQMVSTNKLLNEDIEKYRAENSNLSMKLALAESKLESSLEKCKTLNTAIEKYRRELETIKERNLKFNDIIIKHEHNLNTTTQELNKLNEKVCTYENQLRSITFERDMHKSNHERLVKERDLLILENSSRTSIMTSLEMIKEGFSRNERETHLMFKQKIEQLERENSIQLKQLEQNQEKHDVLVKSWQNQYDQLTQQKEKENEEHLKLKSLYDESKVQLDTIREKLTETESKLHSTELIVQMTRNTKTSSAISRLTQLEEDSKDLQSKLNAAEKDIVSLKIQLEESRFHAKQYKTIGDTMEKALQEASEVNENTKKVLEENISALTESNAKLVQDYNTASADKETMAASLSEERHRSAEEVAKLTGDKERIENELSLVKKNVASLEEILVERTNHRDEYVAKLAVLEEQLVESEARLRTAENELGELKDKEVDVSRSAGGLAEQLEQEKKAREEIIKCHEVTDRMMKENWEKLKEENEGLNRQIELLQGELSKMGQDLLVLQKQDSFKFNSQVTSDVSSANVTTFTPTSTSSASNLLEINRYLRAQKDQTEEKYENLKLSVDISQQRLLTLENDLNFYKRQSLAYETDIAHLQASLEASKNLTADTPSNISNQDNFNLMVDTNKRLREEITSLTIESKKFQDDLAGLEEEFANVKASLGESEMKMECVKGENNCLKVELKRWKDRIDALLSSSDNSAEWQRIKVEMNEANEKAEELTKMINELRSSLSDVNGKYEQLSKESEALRTQAALDKTKMGQQFEALKNDKNKREEMFKSLVADLKEVVTLAQKELQLKDVDWVAMRGPMNEKLTFIKEELAGVKKSISEKVRKDREELAAKIKELTEKTEELNSASKKVEDIEKKKELRINQMMTFIQNQKKKIADLNKEIADLKAASSVQQQQQQEVTTTEITNIHKAEIDNLKSRFLQSKFEVERLKKELETANAAVNDANQKLNTTAPSTSAPPTPTVTTPAVLTQPASQASKIQLSTTTITATQVTSLAPLNTETSQTPTAYIAPSLTRITKVNPQQQQQQQQASSQILTTPSLRRTAAVQPTPHEITPQSTQPQVTNTLITLQRQQLVTPITNIESSQWHQQSQQAISSSQSSGENGQLDQATTETSSQENLSSSQASTSSQSFAKRTREDDQQDDTFHASSSNANSKKQRNSSENTMTFEAPSTSQVIATIEPFTSNNNTAEINEAVAAVGNENQNTANENEEIILDDDSSSDFIVIPESGMQQNELVQSNGGNQADNQMEDYENSQDIVGDMEDDDVTIEQENEECEDENLNVGELDEESLQVDMLNDDEANTQNTDDQDNQNEVDNDNQEEDNNTDDMYTNIGSNSNNNQNSTSPDNSASQEQQQQQQSQLVTVSETNSPAQTVTSFTATSSTPSQTIRLNQQISASAGSVTNSLFNTFKQNPSGANLNQEQRREAPKPIVWNSGTNQQQPQQVFQQQTTTSIHKIRRAPVQQNVNTVGFQQGTSIATLNQATSSPNNNSQNYFQQELQFQQQNQQANRFQNVNNQFSQNNNNTIQGMSMQMNNQSQQIMGGNPEINANMQMGQISNRGMRGGRGGMMRGGVIRRGGANAGGPPNTANRGGRQNF